MAGLTLSEYTARLQKFVSTAKDYASAHSPGSAITTDPKVSELLGLSAAIFESKKQSGLTPEQIVSEVEALRSHVMGNYETAIRTALADDPAYRNLANKNTAIDTSVGYFKSSVDSNLQHGRTGADTALSFAQDFQGMSTEKFKNWLLGGTAIFSLMSGRSNKEGCGTALGWTAMYLALAYLSAPIIKEFAGELINYGVDKTVDVANGGGNHPKLVMNDNAPRVQSANLDTKLAPLGTQEVAARGLS
jgi:hypothetical protein